MVKKKVIVFLSIAFSLTILVVIAIAITTSKHQENSINKINNASVKECNAELTWKELPSNCMFVLDDSYCICKDQIVYNADTTEQYPNISETILLYKIDTGEKKEIIQYPKGYNTLGYISYKDNIFWIEHYTERGDIISGKWKIKSYNISSSEITTIDQGEFDDFQKYAYENISFSDERMLFPVNIDVADDMLVYNKLFDKDGILNIQIVLYNITNGETEIVAQSNDYINDYFYDVSISDGYVVYNRYYEKNDNKNFRPTTYKYCDIYLYNIKNKKTEKITDKDFFIDIDADNGKIAAARIPVLENGQEKFACMQIALYDIKDKAWSIVLHNESPIYDKKEYLMVGNPKIMEDFVIWQDNTVTTHRVIYNYRNNSFIQLPVLDEQSDTSIINATEKKIVCLEIRGDGSDHMYIVAEE